MQTIDEYRIQRWCLSCFDRIKYKRPFNWEDVFVIFQNNIHIVLFDFCGTCHFLRFWLHMSLCASLRSNRSNTYIEWRGAIMEIVSFNDIRESFISNLRRKMIIPIIGSGFTRNCKSYKGRVPSGEDYRQYMIAEICSSLSGITPENLENESFSNISSIYRRAVS